MRTSVLHVTDLEEEDVCRTRDALPAPPGPREEGEGRPVEDGIDGGGQPGPAGGDRLRVDAVPHQPHVVVTYTDDVRLSGLDLGRQGPDGRSEMVSRLRW